MNEFIAETPKAVVDEQFKRQARLEAIRIASTNSIGNNFTAKELTKEADDIYNWLIKEL